MEERLEARAPGYRPLARVLRHMASRYRRTSLYARVVAINASIVTGATVVLIVTPATVGYPIGLAEAVVLVGGVGVVVVANALALRMSFRGLAETVARMESVDLLRPQERLPTVGGPETRAVAAGLNQMLARLESERRESSRRTLAALEGERQRIARELHDEIGQRLTGTLLQLGNLVPDAPRELRERIRGVQEDTRGAIDEVGQLAWQLRPDILDDLGLLRALEALVKSFQEPAPSLRVKAALPASLPMIAPETELAVYRIVQEALTNAFRHSRAENVILAMACKHRHLAVSVIDDGVGIAKDTAESTGMRGMRERALAIASVLAITSAPRAGVHVSLELPLTTDRD